MACETLSEDGFPPQECLNERKCLVYVAYGGVHAEDGGGAGDAGQAVEDLTCCKEPGGKGRR